MDIYASYDWIVFLMKEKYIKFYKTFHKKFKNDENLILCSKTLSYSGIDKGVYLIWIKNIYRLPLF